ncbi:hypothetical protein C1645_834549 [Glomus cerebriforme]|uniref:Uncharacterized protein n=1 Tax=Glomus cerebriforme TaxID=658196 RepID=A0A397S9D6_9GLOM|nr:hypothetical protein C1645_834549 [Glomus cerebriforme]
MVRLKQTQQELLKWPLQQQQQYAYISPICNKLSSIHIPFKENDNPITEIEDSRYNTQTYEFSLDYLNKTYNDLVNSHLNSNGN